MPKYIIIGLAVVIGSFVIISYWGKLKDSSKNKIIASIFGFIAIGFIIRGGIGELLLITHLGLMLSTSS